MAEAVTGVTPFARAWMHVGVVQVGGEKMAKSAGNLVLVGDVVESYPPPVLRLLLIDRPWAQPWDFEPDALDRAAARLERLYAAAARGRTARRRRRAVTTALSANLDVPAALAVAETDGGAAPAGAVGAGPELTGPVPRWPGPARKGPSRGVAARKGLFSPKR